MKISIRIAMIALLTGLDQIVKYLVITNLTLFQSVPFIPFLSFYRTYNEGIAFSGLSFIGNNYLIMMIIVVIGFVLWLWSQLAKNQLFSHIGFAFIISGALGNLIDRFNHGHVIDYIQVHTTTWSFAIFNLADSFIFVGAALIIFDEIRQVIKSKRELNNE